jgi:hypothetical protein
MGNGMRGGVEPGNRGRLTVPEGDSAFGQIVRGHLEGDFIAGQDANPVAAQPAREMRENHPFVLELHAEQTAGKLL